MLARALALGITAALLSQPAIAELWMWTDGEGAVRYTSHRNRIPAAQRPNALAVQPGMTLPAPPDPAEPASEVQATHAPPGAISLPPDPFNAPTQTRTLSVDDVGEPEGADTWETSVEQPPSEPAAAVPATSVAAVPATERSVPETPAEMSPTETPAETTPEPEPEPAAVPAPSVAAVPETPHQEPGAPVPAATKPDDSDPGAAWTDLGTAVSAPPPPAETESAISAKTDSASSTEAESASSTEAESANSTEAESANSTEAESANSTETSDREQRARELREMIDRDQATLKSLISDPDAKDVEDSPELREIARRLPRLQAELRSLERGEPAPTETGQ